MRKITQYVKGSTAKGRRLIESGSRNIGTELRHIYGRYSQSMVNAWEDCWKTYREMEDSTAWSICSKNSYGFTCSWCAKLNGEEVMIFCTPSNTYCIYLDR